MASSSGTCCQADALQLLVNCPDDDAFFTFPPHPRHYPFAMLKDKFNFFKPPPNYA
jgi:hypothetical protein